MDKENSTFLSRLNEQETYRQIPVAVFLGVIGITGLIGNAIACYIYGAVFTQSISRVFMVCLAITDLCMCIVDIPLEIYILLNQYEFEIPILCKLSRTGNTLAAFYAISILVSIAIDRYRKICRPHGFQMSNGFIKRLCVVLFFGTLVFTWPAFIMYGVKTTFFKHEGVNLIRKECLINDEYKDSIYSMIYNFLMMFQFVLALSLLGILYSLIGRKVRYFAYNHKNKKDEVPGNNYESEDDVIDLQNQVRLKSWRKTDVEEQIETAHDPLHNTVQEVIDNKQQSKNDNPEQPCSHSRSIDLNNSKELQIKSLKKAKVDVQTVQAAEKHLQNYFQVCDDNLNLNNGTRGESSQTLTLNDTAISKVEYRKKSLRHKPTSTQLRQIKQKRKLAKTTTRLMFVVTGSFIIVYLPFILLSILDSVITDFEENMGDEWRVVYRLFLRMYFLSAAVNPIIYGIFDKRFMNACKEALRHMRITICRSADVDMT